MTTTDTKAIERAEAAKHRAAEALYTEARNIVERVRRAEGGGARPMGRRRSRGARNADEVLAILDELSASAKWAAASAERVTA